MHRRWSVVLPVIGILLFAGLTYNSVKVNREDKKPNGRYFRWSSIRLDSDPLNKYPPASTQCKADTADCVEWNPVSIWADPGWLAMLLVLSAFPVFVVGVAIVHGLGRLGISEITSFMLSMPLLIVAWYYSVGWLVDLWITRYRSTPGLSRQ